MGRTNTFLVRPHKPLWNGVHALVVESLEERVQEAFPPQTTALLCAPPQPPSRAHPSPAQIAGRSRSGHDQTGSGQGPTTSAVVDCRSTSNESQPLPLPLRQGLHPSPWQQRLSPLPCRRGWSRRGGLDGVLERMKRVQMPHTQKGSPRKRPLSWS